MIRYRESYPKADPAPSRRARAPLFEIFYGCIFGNFDSITRTNLIVINKQSSDLKNYTAPGPRPPVFKFLDPPLHMTSCNIIKSSKRHSDRRGGIL